MVLALGAIAVMDQLFILYGDPDYRGDNHKEGAKQVAEMNIKFFVPSDQIIPTYLRLIADGVHVFYNRLSDRFAYRFTVYTTDENLAANIVEEVARRMCNQSYDHGVSWRIENVALIPTESVVSLDYEVVFRLRDAG